MDFMDFMGFMDTLGTLLSLYPTEMFVPCVFDIASVNCIPIQTNPKIENFTRSVEYMKPPYHAFNCIVKLLF